MGTNMWSDVPVKSWGRFKSEDLHLVCQADHLRFDEAVWRTLTECMQKVRMNMVVIDLGEAIQYQSHPELAVKGSWPVEKFRKELARLRAMGLEPIPKLNFSTTHDTWLKEYGRQVSTPTYYRVCADLVREVLREFSLRPISSTWATTRKGPQTRGSTATWSCGKGNMAARFLVLRQRSRATGRAAVDLVGLLLEPSRRIPCTNAQIGAAEQLVLRRDVRTHEAGRRADLSGPRQSGLRADPDRFQLEQRREFQGYGGLLSEEPPPQRLKGFLMAPWFFTLNAFQEKNLQAIEQVAEMIREHL